MPDQNIGEKPIKDICFEARAEIETLKVKVLAMKDHESFKGEAQEGVNRNETRANIMIAYRRLEDARMRLGKAVQAQDGGTSVYPR